ncbi:MAG: hypothetical protein ACYTEU_04535, partial [Planctomycetota bacterium]
MKTTRIIITLAALFTVLVLNYSTGWAMSEEESFEKYGQVFKGKIAESYAESEEWWPETPKPPAGTPNVLLILLDDTGFGHLGCFGG